MEKVIVGMSGGIDSSVAALLLKNKGYEVIGITLKHLGEDDSENSNSKTCCSLDDIYDAKRACQKIGIMHYVMDAQEEFKKEVIDYFVESYNKGVTPSPCVICDEKIKIKQNDKKQSDHIRNRHPRLYHRRSNAGRRSDFQSDEGTFSSALCLCDPGCIFESCGRYFR
jgi:tRNA-specific 2-thiouridylase